MACLAHMASAIWTGLFHLTPDGRGEDPLDGALGALAYAAAEADGHDFFIAKVNHAAAEWGLRVTTFQEVGKAMARGIRGASSEHRKLMSVARHSGTVAWGTFHSYDSDSD